MVCSFFSMWGDLSVLFPPLVQGPTIVPDSDWIRIHTFEWMNNDWIKATMTLRLSETLGEVWEAWWPASGDSSFKFSGYWFKFAYKGSSYFKVLIVLAFSQQPSIHLDKLVASLLVQVHGTNCNLFCLMRKRILVFQILLIHLVIRFFSSLINKMIDDKLIINSI